MKHGLIKHAVIKHGLIKHVVIKHGLIKHGVIKHGLIKHGVIKHGVIKHGLIKHAVIKHAVMKHGLIKHGVIKHGLIKHRVIKHGLIKHRVIKHGLIKHGLMKHGVIKHGLIRHGVKTVKLIQKLSPREELLACEQQTHFRSSLLSLRSDDRKCVCCSQAKELHARVQRLTLVEKPAGAMKNFTFQERSKKKCSCIRGQIMPTKNNKPQPKSICVSRPLSLKSAAKLTSVKTFSSRV